MTKDAHMRLTVWPVTVLALTGHGWIVLNLLPLQSEWPLWLEINAGWSASWAQALTILLGVPLFAIFMGGIVLTFYVSAIAAKAISKGWL